MRSKPSPLGATLMEGGANFAIYSRNASSVHLCLYANKFDSRPTRTIDLKEKTNNVWHVFVPGVSAGQLYGYRVVGPYAPEKGLRFNRHKMLVDPYAKAITHKHDWHDSLHFGYDSHGPDQDMTIDRRENDRLCPKCVVIDDAFDWQGVNKPSIHPRDLLIYEVHLKGFTRHPSSETSHPGTYLGFIEKIPYLKDLGINAVEFLPVHETGSEQHLVSRDQTNYWGYNTLGFFAPDSRFASSGEPGAQVAEFKRLVRELHRAGIEVFLDVVFNHTCEGNQNGPTYCFRGIDNPTYYKLAPGNPRLYWDVTGCGNTLNVDHPRVVQLFMDSLRYWVRDYQIDGFRFDLATTLGRVGADFQSGAPLFVAMQQDPILQSVKLIAEPWDLGGGGYQLGNFPIVFQEWNDRYRDNLRSFFRGEPGQLSNLGFSITGSSNLFGDDDRNPYNSINFVTAHDGFTLADLVSYNAKHNEPNKENNRDGYDNNRSFHHGAEGPTDDPKILAARRQTMKNFLAALFLSQGVPMLTAGDEFGRTQHGNNNAYCQDNEVSWLDYRFLDKNADHYRFCRKLIEFRKRHIAFRRESFFLGKCRTCGAEDISWFGPKGGPIDWRDSHSRFLAYLINGVCVEDHRNGGDRDMLVLVNMEEHAVKFPLPTPPQGGAWACVVDTSMPSPYDILDSESDGMEILRLPEYSVASRSFVLLMQSPASTQP